MSGTGFTPNTPVAVFQCANSAAPVDGHAPCDANPPQLHTTTTDGFGSFFLPADAPGSLIVHQLMTSNTLTPGTFDCPVVGCFVVAHEAAGSALATLGFSPGVTPAGTNVVAQPLDPATNATGAATVTFSTVTSAGITSLTSSPAGPVVPAGFQLGAPGIYYDITTTATYTGSITVCLSYDPSAYLDGANLALFHYSAGWQDVTTSRDLLTHVICGQTTSLSPFAVLAVTYDFAGFFAPVDNPSILNVAKAGSAIPVKFRLGGDRGLEVLAAGYPKSVVIECGTNPETDIVEQTATASTSGLTYDSNSEQYKYIWKTDRSWTGTCRQLIVKLADGSVHRANFKLT